MSQGHPAPLEPLAIIGIGCRFPGGANNAEAYWQMLLAGTDAMTDVPIDRWQHRNFYHPEPGKPGKTVARQAAFIEGIADFDCAFFGVSPREAAQMDPQHRLALEVSWEAVEDAGLDLGRIAGSPTAVFVGVSSREYAGMQRLETVGTYSSTGQASCMTANRISYAFDFTGPSVAVDTACSSSLVAVHMACRSIWDGESPMALAAGVNLLLDPTTFISFSALGMLSPDSRCRAFDARANGFARAEGAGAILIKPLSRAQADGDRIDAVILATGVNQDGHSQGLTFPSQVAQEKLLSEVYARAGVAPEEVNYIEAHGTGTQAGDPVETSALGEVLGRGRTPGRELVIGSVKTNIGHLESAAGIAGVIKACLVLKHRLIPKNLHFEEPNPRIPFAELGLRVAATAERLDGPARQLAGVNGFGFGGTNGHVLLAEAPLTATPAPASSPTHFLLPLSARSPEALRALACAYDELLASPDSPALADLCYSATVRRTHHSHRFVVSGSDAAALRERLASFLAGREEAGITIGHAKPGRPPRIAFVFTGQGPQWWAMGRELLDAEPVFAEVIARCDAVIRSLGDWSLLAELRADEAHSRLQETAIAQPALFALQAGLTALWRAHGIEPAAVTGHSVGEIAAALAAGVMDLEEATRVAFHRGGTMDRTSSQGAMLAVGLSEKAVAPYLAGRTSQISIAALNSPVSLTLSGDPATLQEVAAELERDSVVATFLRVNYAFHSPQMDPVETDLRAALHDLAPRAATVPLVSTVTGNLSPGTEWNAEYWWHNLRHTVHFAEAIGTLISHGCDTFLEIGPHPALSGSIKEVLRERGVSASALASLRRGEPESAFLLSTLATLYALGAPVRWMQLYPTGRTVPLPRYPWQHEKYWTIAEGPARELSVRPSTPLLGSPVVAARAVWKNRLDVRLTPFLADHRFQSTPVFPATGYLEMALAAGLENLGSTTLAIEDVDFESALFLPADESVQVETRFLDATRFEIFARNRRDGSWMRHACGRTLPLPASDALPEPLATVRLRLTETIGHDAIYELFAASGLDYGPAFRGILSCVRTDGEALGEVQLPADLIAELADHPLHPALLDACFQVTLAALPRSLRPRGAFLPIGVGSLRYHQCPGSSVHAHVRLREATDSTLAADVRLLDETGALLVEIKDFRCRVVESEAGRRDPLNELLYVSEWQEQVLAEAPAPTDAGTWLIFADTGGLASQLRQQLTAQGQHALVVAPSPESKNGAAFAFDPAQPQAMRHLLQSVARSGEPPVTRVVYLRGLDTAAPEETMLDSLAADETHSVTALLELVQALAEWPDATPPRLWLVTHRAQPTPADAAAPLSVGQSPLWGFRRVIAFEQPRLRPAIVDLGSATGEIEALVAEMLAGGAEDEVALRTGQRFVHRYARTTLERWTPERSERIAPNAAHFRAQTPRLGVLDRLRFVATPPPPLAGHEVRIEVKAAALNFSDVLKALGLYPGATASSVSLGAEGAGVITELGSGVTDGLKIGDRVVTIAPHCFGGFVTTPGVYALPIPDTLSFEQAAAIPIVFMTAQYALEDIGRLQPGERVLIHAATGGVGLAAIQIANRIGAEVFATAGTPEKREYLRALGVRHIMDSRSLAFADEVLAATNGEGVDLVLNSLAGEAIAKGVSVLRPFGRFVEIGKRDIYANAPLGLRAMRNNITFAAVDLDQAIRTRPDLVVRLFRTVIRGFADGAFQPLPVNVFPMTELVDAFRHLSKAQHIGKVILSNEVPDIEVVFPHESLPIRSDATYLITGGVNGFARTLAEWLADRGARHLVLVSRSGPAASGVKEAIEALAARGATAHVWAADVAAEQPLRSVLERIAAELPLLRGVIHAAMVIDAGVLIRLDRERWNVVTRPKIAGSWNLHAQTLGLPLDFFVLTSSIASIYGSPGQANYAAANAFLDALAHHRRALGLPALTLNLGSLGAVGHVARHEELNAYLTQMGFAPMEPAQVLEALGHLLGTEAAQIGVVRMDFQRLSSVLKHAMPPRFAALAAMEGQRSERGDADRPLLRALCEAAPGEGEKLLLEALVREMSRVLGIAAERLEIDQPLMALGVDSLMTVEIINWAEDALGAKLPTVEIMQNPTTTELARLLWRAISNQQTSASSTSASVLREDTQLDPAITFAAGETAPLQARRPLLTGATGFLGAFLLHELLSGSDAVIHCLVRADDPAAAVERLRKNLAAYRLEVADLEDRVVPVIGDLSKPLLGLTPEAFAQLAETVDGIYHAAAIVDFLRPYSVLRPANVGGTQEILRLAATGRPKRLQYVSSIAVLAATHHSGLIGEGVVPEAPAGFPDGYSESKWVAEMLVREAMRRGLKANIFRLGVISGHTETGEPNFDDASSLLFVASCLTGALPDFEWPVDMMPVDVAARAIHYIATHEHDLSPTFHLANPEPTPVSEVTGWLGARGIPVERMPYPQWLERMRANAPSLAFEHLLSLLVADQSAASRRLGAADRRFDTANTLRALSGSGIELPRLDEEQFGIYIRFLEDERMVVSRTK
jgi:thioester reductase-like protein